MPQRPDEVDQLKQVLEVQQQFPPEGLWWAYKDKHEFKRLVRRHLTQFLGHRQAQAAAASPGQGLGWRGAAPLVLDPRRRTGYGRTARSDVGARRGKCWLLGT